MKRSKRYNESAALVDGSQLYTAEEAISIIKQYGVGKSDESVEVSMRLGVDPRKADQMVRGTVNLPHGTGKTARVLVFAQAPRRPRLSKLVRTRSVQTSSSRRSTAATSTLTRSLLPRT